MGYYFPTTRYGALGLERFAGAEVIGWRIRYRTYGHAQTIEHPNPSRFGALRAVIRRCRSWHGRMFLLEILEIKPLVRAEEENDR